MGDLVDQAEQLGLEVVGLVAFNDGSEFGLETHFKVGVHTGFGFVGLGAFRKRLGSFLLGLGSGSSSGFGNFLMVADALPEALHRRGKTMSQNIPEGVFDRPAGAVHRQALRRTGLVSGLQGRDYFLLVERRPDCGFGILRLGGAKQGAVFARQELVEQLLSGGEVQTGVAEQLDLGGGQDDGQDGGGGVDGLGHGRLLLLLFGSGLGL